jgi:hypothetical protein
LCESCPSMVPGCDAHTSGILRNKL